MCGICGFCDFHRDNSTLPWREAGHQMGEALNHRGPDDKGLWQGRDCVLVHRRLSVMDPERGCQPMVRERGESIFTLVYNGEIYNAPALRRELEGLGYSFATDCDTEVVLCACMEWGEGAASRLEGIFAYAFWDSGMHRLLLCRDRLGVKPLFYTRVGESFVFASELKSLFRYPGLTPKVGRESLCQVLGLGPARTPGHGVFEGMWELEPGCQMDVTPGGERTSRYWSLASHEHTDSYEETVERVRGLLSGAIRRQLVSDVPLCTFLSGGLDSSIITAVAAEEYRRQGRPALESFSFEYTDNDKYFKASAFQPDSDAQWAQRVADAVGTRHRVLRCDIPNLVHLLPQATRGRDLPGMADVDSSLLYFCSQVAQDHVVALSGECADEVFGGYPWFEREELMNADTFPWCPDPERRKEVIRPELWGRLGVADYVQDHYRRAVASTPRLDGETGSDARRREIGWLSINWFMACLLERKDRMSMASGLEVRVPFCDHHLIEYVWNIPWQMKTMNGQRKQVLRDAAKGLLPEPVRSRPKSPYPKTHHPLYEQMVRAKLLTILDNKDAPIHAIVEEDKLRAGLLSNGGDYGKPWFGQLMAGPQLLAWLIQLNGWLEEYPAQL